ncbi:MAG: pyridoxal phosphate-dependent aminotransferase family protein [Cereibacter changlensis]
MAELAQAMTMGGPIGPRMRIDGREVDYFCGTSYFALHGHPSVIDAACDATRRFGMGPGTLASVPVYDELQQALRDWFAAEHVTFLISGYVSPMALLQAVCEPGDLLLIDAATHYAVRDAVPTLDLPVARFHHLSPDDLAETLRRELKPGQRPVVITDGVFPSSGRLAPLADYDEVLGGYEEPLLCIDDSHGFGILGDGGRGTLEHFGTERAGRYAAGTLSKAFGALGGVIPGAAALATRLRERARILRGASPPPPAAAGAALAALRLLKADPSFRQRLRANVKQMRNGLRELGFELPDNPVPIVTLRDDGRDLVALAAALAERDILVKLTPASGYSDAPPMPTLRIAVFSEHSPEQIDRLIRSVAELA